MEEYACFGAWGKDSVLLWAIIEKKAPPNHSAKDGRNFQDGATGFQGGRGANVPSQLPPKSHWFRRLWYLPTQDLCQQVDSHSSEVARSAGEGLPGRRSWGRERGERVIL